MLNSIPSGLKEIIQIFGDPSDSNFELQQIVSFNLPYPLYFEGNICHRSRCHKLAIDNFIRAFTDIKENNLTDGVKNYAGIYCQRLKRTSNSHLSVHSWGIAIDLEPNKFPLGSTNRFPNEIISIFKNAGFFYGGDFLGTKDPMHFQLCSNY